MIVHISKGEYKTRFHATSATALPPIKGTNGGVQEKNHSKSSVVLSGLLLLIALDSVLLSRQFVLDSLRFVRLLPYS